MASEVSEPVTPPSSWREQLRGGSFPLMLIILLGLLLFRSPDFVWGDTWFNLVLGREIAASGIIFRDATTALGWGTPVIDVQWLAHLVFFVIADNVGIGGLVSIGATWIAACITLGGVIALRAGASPGRVLLSTIIAFTALGSPPVLRAQTLVYPLLMLFPAVLWRDAQVPSGWKWLLVPLAVLWANLHGSVLLAPVFAGALLVARALDARRDRRPVSKALAAGDAALMLALLGSIFVTPYGFEVWRYYAQTAGNPIFRQYVTEWWPLWMDPDPYKIALLVVVAAAITRSWRSVGSYPVIVLFGLCVMQVTSKRHVTPLALACVVFLPHLLDKALGPRFTMDFREFNPRRAAGTLMAIAAAFVVGIPLGAREAVTSPDPTSAEARLASETAGPCLLVDEQQADRLMWYYPSLIGRLTHSARMETIPAWFVQQTSTTYAAPRTASSRDFLRRFPIVAMDDRLNGSVIETLSRDPQFERLGTTGRLHVFRNRRAKMLADPCARKG
jgi:hypothetical protein